MKFTEINLKGAYLIELEPIADQRGFFARSWCQDEFKARGLNPALVQCNISFNKERATLRGMHYQIRPHEEAKLVRCTAGEIFDVIVDIRPGSMTFGQWFGTRLSASNRQALYVPEGFAHGFQTLTENAEVFYQMSESYHPECARGMRWNDPILRGVDWPAEEPIVSPRDRQFPDFKP